jgi:hypothetical protein
MLREQELMPLKSKSKSKIDKEDKDGLMKSKEDLMRSRD